MSTISQLTALKCLSAVTV
uniref:Uncharacterized protein n=1 Tax=Anguilla anguilla TaxID=7936 RepID=A0A0E9UXW4_ANGAN